MTTLTLSPLAAKIHQQRADKIRRQMDDDALHSRSHFPDMETDGADAYAHGYTVSHCPYANTQQIDAAGIIAPTLQQDIQKAAAWRRGWQNAAFADVRCATSFIVFWEKLNLALAARRINGATYREARDFFDFGDTNAERVAKVWSQDEYL
jgi:hypothetical protein